RRGYEAPVGGTERALAEIWSEVLGVERVGRGDDFFELGGHSLLVIRVVSRVRQALGVELPVRALFEAPAVAALAERVDALRGGDGPALSSIVPVADGAALPLSFAQERMWFADRMQPGGALFNVPVALRLDGALDVPALERALGELVRRHAVLRTVFAEAGGEPVQVIAPFAGFTLAVEAADGADGKAREAAALRRARDEAERPFDLAAGPLFRPCLLRVDPDAHVLLLCMHHAVTDAWSTGILFRELAALYGAYRAGGASPLAEPALRYADFAAWQRAHLSGAVLQEQLAYWRQALAGAPALLELPADHPRPAAQSYRAGVVPMELPPRLAERLEQLARAEGATLFMVLLGAFQALLARYAGSDDVVVGTTVAGRTWRETEEMVGVFINALPLRTRLDGDPAFREVVRRVRQATLGAFDHQEVPFERLVAELHPERTLSHAPVFQVLFELHEGRGASGATLDGVQVQGLDVGTDTVKYDLSLALTTTERGLEGVLAFAADLWQPATVRRMTEQLARILEQVANDADLPLSRLRLIGDAERTQVVETWNRPPAAYPAERCIHELFEAQAARTPDMPAVTFAGETLTFRELDARANQVANHLLRLGVGPEVRVGLCLERGHEMMPAILGVMKAGGAYVPVDPGHPAERIGYVLEDSAVAVVLTQARLRERLPLQGGVRVVCVDEAWDEIARESADKPASGVTSENLCYVIYTSGSTGRPKGVAMHHRGVVNYI
ncbi:MAG TPA: condensation domain-containing protein, partial [Longimicrobium sp.]